MLSTAMPAFFSNSWNLHSGGENKVFRPHYNIFSSPILWHLWNMRPPSLGLTLFMSHPAAYVSSHNVSADCTAACMILQKNRSIQEPYILVPFKTNRAEVKYKFTLPIILQLFCVTPTVCPPSAKYLVQSVVQTVPLVKVVGEGFFGISEKLLPSRPEPLHSFFSVAVGAEVSMLLSNFRHNLEKQERRNVWWNIWCWLFKKKKKKQKQRLIWSN